MHPESLNVPISNLETNQKQSINPWQKETPTLFISVLLEQINQCMGKISIV